MKVLYLVMEHIDFETRAIAALEDEDDAEEWAARCEELSSGGIHYSTQSVAVRTIDDFEEDRDELPIS